MINKRNIFGAIACSIAVMFTVSCDSKETEKKDQPATETAAPATETAAPAEAAPAETTSAEQIPATAEEPAKQ